MNGTIFNIQKFCTNDGPGIRTTVFFKGCPLHCAWCHNPESHSVSCEMLFDAEKCTGCGKCVTVCKNNAHTFENGLHIYNRNKCDKCGNCADTCYQNALEEAGKSVSPDEVLDDVLKDKVFYDNSGGGITLSGGEPLLQFDFAYELLKKAKEKGLNTCIETCGFVDCEKILKAAKYIDTFLFDWKITDDELHKKYTGVSNSMIKYNLYAIDNAGSKIILRCPIIPDVNDNSGHFSGIADLANSLNNTLGIEIEPYHPLGNSKYGKLDKATKVFKTPGDADTEHWIKELQSLTKVPVKKA